MTGRRYILCFTMTLVLFGTIACGDTESGQPTACPSAHFDATVVASSPDSTELRLFGAAGCDGGELEVLLIQIPAADAPLGPSMRDDSYVVLWSTGEDMFDHTLTVDHLVTLANGQTADAGEGHWMLGVREGDTMDVQPLPEGF